jgi:hypothetical protein
MRQRDYRRIRPDELLQRVAAPLRVQRQRDYGYK